MTNTTNGRSIHWEAATLFAKLVKAAFFRNSGHSDCGANGRLSATSRHRSPPAILE